MFLPELVTAGYLLAISTTALAGTYRPNVEPAGEYKRPHHHTTTTHPTPTPTPTLSISSSSSSSSSSPHTLPASCYTTWDDWQHTTATVKTHPCYTRTSLIPPASCPTLSCPPRSTDQVCPLYIKLSSITVPCATDCCPTTSTVYLESPARSSGSSTAPACPTCEVCPVPVEWITYTTGCVGTPTITEVNIITTA
ncbi:hypothetical protein F4803DRAFT_573424 [Xylaria telfairii]|nr:hypothetical protein F4803DRAFT_573424 [Xylaria telfairii]